MNKKHINSIKIAILHIKNAIEKLEEIPSSEIEEKTDLEIGFVINDLEVLKQQTENIKNMV